MKIVLGIGMSLVVTFMDIIVQLSVVVSGGGDMRNVL